MTALAPQVSELLASLSKSPPAPPWDVPITAYRAAGERLAALAGSSSTACDVRNFDIQLSGRSLSARSYRPEGAVGNVPGVVYFHGGGFVRGSLDSHDRLCRELSVQGGFSVIAVAYRLAPEDVFPSAHDDALDSFCWVSDHADDLQLRSDALAVAGDSAGAMLAASVALRLQDGTDHVPVRAQGLLCPVLDATLASTSVTTFGDAPFLSRPVLTWCVDQYFPDAESRRSELASIAMESPLTAAPPAVIISAQVDPVSGDARRYFDRLQESQVHSEWLEHTGMPHSFFLLAGVLPQGEEAISQFAEKLSGLLH